MKSENTCNTSDWNDEIGITQKKNKKSEIIDEIIQLDHKGKSKMNLE